MAAAEDPIAYLCRFLPAHDQSRIVSIDEAIAAEA
jgi:hypothetical protein